MYSLIGCGGLPAFRCSDDLFDAWANSCIPLFIVLHLFHSFLNLFSFWLRAGVSLIKQLGSGAFSVVREGSNKATGDSYAIKIVTKSKLSKEDEVALKDEIDVLQELQHPNIIRLYDVFEEKEYYYLVTEKMMGGELFDRIVQKSYYNEKEARDTCVILFKAIEYCHVRQIAHRDLKPENLLLQVRASPRSLDDRQWLFPYYSPV